MKKLSALFALYMVSHVTAYSLLREEIPNGYNVQHPCKANDVWHGVGHLSQQGGGPRNVFGKDFYGEGKQWTKTLCQKDSDGDGKTNGEELGDPQCTWTSGSTPNRTTDITHPGFRTPTSKFPYSLSDKTTLDCSAQYVCPGRDLPDTKKMDLRMATGTKVLAKTTTYYCATFAVPSDQIYHAISFEPILDNLNVIHHMLVYGCEFNDSSEVGKPGECGMSSKKCRDLLGVWSLGLPGQCSPPEAGVHFGKGTYSYFQLQVHWNNPQNINTYTDTSGMRVYYTSKLRPYDLGIMWVGQRKLFIPARTPSTSETATCSSHCMKELLALGVVQVTSAIAHMHLLGKAASIEKIDKNNNTVSIINEPVYDYNTPKWTDHKPYITLGATDRLTVNCTFDSSTRNTNTTYGDATDDEMCYGFIQYYPKRGDIRCTQQGTADVCYYESTVCGPRCELSHYMDVAVATINRALVECQKVVTHSDCTQQCANDVVFLIRLLKDNCTKVRHPKASSAFLKAISPYIQDLSRVAHPCFNIHGRIPVLPPLVDVTNATGMAEESNYCPTFNGVSSTRSPQLPTVGSSTTGESGSPTVGISTTGESGSPTVGISTTGESGSSQDSITVTFMTVLMAIILSSCIFE